MLPRIRAVTEGAVREVDQLSSVVQRLEEADPARARTIAEVEAVVAAWTGQLQELGVVVKGLWLVDFDNGDGFYCWSYPEASILHYHGYDEGFAGRMKVV